MEQKVNPILAILSIFIPIIGYVLYFVKKSESEEVANNYLWTAIAGSVIGVLVSLFM